MQDLLIKLFYDNRPDAPFFVPLKQSGETERKGSSRFLIHLSFFEAAPTGAVFPCKKKPLILSELHRTHIMHDWTLNGIDRPAVHDQSGTKWGVPPFQHILIRMRSAVAKMEQREGRLL